MVRDVCVKATSLKTIKDREGKDKKQWTFEILVSDKDVLDGYDCRVVNATALKQKFRKENKDALEEAKQVLNKPPKHSTPTPGASALELSQETAKKPKTSHKSSKVSKTEEDVLRAIEFYRGGSTTNCGLILFGALMQKPVPTINKVKALLSS